MFMMCLALQLTLACFLTAKGYSFVWDNTQIEVRAQHQSRQYSNRFKLWALMFAVQNRVSAPQMQPSTPKLWYLHRFIAECIIPFIAVYGSGWSFTLFLLQFKYFSSKYSTRRRRIECPQDENDPHCFPYSSNASSIPQQGQSEETR